MFPSHDPKAFHGLPSHNKLVADHIDRNLLNNNVENLRWTTQSVNARNRSTPPRYKENRLTEDMREYLRLRYLKFKQNKLAF